jgi:tetrahydromethanopterin S-methyltransferase subunit B
MDTAAIIVKLHEIERKIEKMQALIDDIEKSQ